ncbi:hypothetical protein V8C34DRAFT_296655 [Trichoderma compactum]
MGVPSHPPRQLCDMAPLTARLPSPKAGQGREAARSVSPTNDGASPPPVTALVPSKGRIHREKKISHFPASNARIVVRRARTRRRGSTFQIASAAVTLPSKMRKRKTNLGRQGGGGSQISGIQVPPARRRVRSPSELALTTIQLPAR